jgi:hypothetical protein
MNSQTLILACIAAFYPLGLLAIGVLLATDRPLILGTSFLAGAVTSLLVIGVVVISVLDGAGLARDSATTARGWLRIGLGIALVIVGTQFARSPDVRSVDRKTGPASEPVWQARLRRARPVTVFLTGAILYSPSATYIGAVQQIATTEASWPQGLQLIVVIAIVLLTVEIPLLAYAWRPEATTRTVRIAEAWTERHRRETLSAVFLAIGTYLLIDGLVTIS